MTRTAIHPRTGKLVTPEEFIRREGPQWRDKAYPRCPACGADLTVHGVHSTNVTACFRHHPGAACPLSSTPDPRFAHLVPEAWDPEGGERLKAAFCEDENLKQAYMVCHRLCGDRLTSDEFANLCDRAYHLGLFRYKGLPLWVLPWLLVTLTDFSRKKRNAARREEMDSHGNDRKKEEFTFRFILIKPVRTGIEAVWTDPSQCSLEKVFADSGKRMRNGLIPLGDPSVETARQNTDWINRALLRSLHKCCQRLGGHD